MSLNNAFLTVAALVALMWAVLLVGELFGLPLHQLGVYPRELASLHGVITAPLVHGSPGHLFANTPALLVLGTAIVYVYPRSAPIAIAAIWLGSGLGVWLFARPSFHIGASGLTHGLMFFVFLIGILRRDRPAIALALLAFFLYGGMIWTIFPHDPDVSFEAHLFGALMGVLMAVLLRRRDPLLEHGRYGWEDDDEDPDEPLADGKTRLTPEDLER